jgi:transcriptional regulator with XRE-family HTH domain
MADECGLSHGTLSAVLNHERSPSLAFFEKMATGLGVSIVELLALAGIAPPLPPAVKNERRLLLAYRRLMPRWRAVLIDVAEVMPQADPGDEIHALLEGLGTDALRQVAALIRDIKER